MWVKQEETQNTGQGERFRAQLSVDNSEQGQWILTGGLQNKNGAMMLQWHMQ